MSTEQRERVIVGRIAGVYGVRGWVKVFSETAPKENIFKYSPWQIRVADEWRNIRVVEGRPQGKGLVAQLESYTDRDQVRELVGAEIAVFRDQLPRPKEGEYYWADMIGLKVVTLDGQELGVVDHLFETGANDVLVVKGERERLIPFVQGQFVQVVDLEAGQIRVDWDPEF
jgi:16S rRNA processing protein RimM